MKIISKHNYNIENTDVRKIQKNNVIFIRWHISGPAPHDMMLDESAQWELAIF